MSTRPALDEVTRRNWLSPGAKRKLGTRDAGNLPSAYSGAERALAEVTKREYQRQRRLPARSRDWASRRQALGHFSDYERTGDPNPHHIGWEYQP